MSDTNTTNYGFTKPDFNSKPWDGKINGNFDLLDSILYTLVQIPNIAGVWRNSTAYTVGQNVLDSSSLVFYQCLVANTSAAAGTFAADRLANPSYWGLANTGQGSVRYDMGQALTAPQILQAQTNINLFAQFLRFDAAQTLTYNNMLQVLNTLGIDGTESTIASAATTDISNVNTQAVAIAGTTAITSFGPRANKYKLVRFTGSLTLTHSSALSLPGAANIITQVGDTCVAFSDGATPTANWTIRGYTRGDGSLLGGKPILAASQTLTSTEQKVARDNINAAYGEDLKSALIMIAKLRGTSLGLGNYLADDFNDTSGIDLPNAVNVGVSGGILSNDSYTKALLHFDTNLTDTVGHTATNTGNSSVSTAQFKFGPASLLVGTGALSYVSYGSNADWLVFGADYTIETFVYCTNNNSGNHGFILIIGNSSSDRFVLTVQNTQINILSGGGVVLAVSTLPNNTWSHLAVVKSGATTTLYLNGNSIGNFSSNPFPSTGTPQFAVGGDAIGGSSVNNFIGYVDEVRISKGVARYTGTFTPPTAPFTFGAGGNITLPSVSTAAAATPSRASMYALVKQTAGTLNMNTNMIFSASRDGGNTYTQFTLANVGAYGGYTIYEQNVLDISSQPVGSSVRYKAITNDTNLGIAVDAVLFQWG